MLDLRHKICNRLQGRRGFVDAEDDGGVVFLDHLPPGGRICLFVDLVHEVRQTGEHGAGVGIEHTRSVDDVSEIDE